jgi:polysaccharide pyruvyl transferase WcaK-like protein
MGKRLFIAYMYGPRNAGDTALNYGALDLLNAVGDFQITGLSRFSFNHDGYRHSKEKLEPAYPNFYLIPFPISYDRHTMSVREQVSAHIRGTSMYLASVLNLPHRQAYELDTAIKESDHFPFNGGNVLFSRGYKDIMRLAAILYPLSRAASFNKPVAFLPQSIPARCGLGGRWIRGYLDRAWLVSFRESISYRGVDLNSNNTLCTLDLAFFIDRMYKGGAESILKRHELKPYQFVPVLPRAMTLGDQSYLPQHEYDGTIRLILRLCKGVMEMGFSPLLIVQVQTDIKVARDCQAALAADGCIVGLEEEYDPFVLRALYASARAVFTMRLHAAIFALSVGTVAIGFYRSIWGQKMPGTFSDLGIGDLCFALDAAEEIEPNDVCRISYEEDLDRYRRVFLDQIRTRRDELVTRLRQGLQ